MKDALISKIVELCEPIVTDLGYELYHVEFVKEGGEDYLRIYIDNEEGICLDDCVKVNKAISNALDVEDPIEGFYYLEVSSPGMERVLHTDKHLSKNIDSKVTLKLNGLINGKKKLEGILKDFDENNITILCEEEECIIPREKISIIKLKGEF